ncbi:MAG: hypothetical protein WA419_16990 [Silvibacterium sp.]
MADKKEPFVPQSDRPDVKIDPNKRVSDLTVRDLQLIIAPPPGPSGMGHPRPYKPFVWDIVDKFVHKDANKIEKIEHKDWILEVYTWPQAGPDPEAGIAQLVSLVGGLDKRIDDLADQIAEMNKTK